MPRVEAATVYRDPLRARLPEMPRLRSLTLDLEPWRIAKAEPSGSGATFGSQFPALSTLLLIGDAVSDDHVAIFETSALRNLWVIGTSISTARLASGLRRLKGLERLEISTSEEKSRRVADAIVPVLFELPQLRSVDLTWTRL